MKIRYIAQYADLNAKNRRICSPAGVAKMNYMLFSLAECKHSVEVYSTCAVQNRRFVGIKHTLNEYNQQVIYRSSFWAHNKYTRFLERIFCIIQLIFYLLRIPSTDIILVYHERFYMPWIRRIRKIKGFRIIYEVEEIYCIAANSPEPMIRQEIDWLKDLDGYILSTGALARTLGLKQDDFIVCNGVYAPLYKEKTGFSDGLIHILYGGTFNPVKGGGIAAIKAARYLDASYSMHICGFGSANEIQHVKDTITAMRSSGCLCPVIYEGCLLGDRYLDFMRKCDIGLSTQNPDGAYNATSFPSKIFEYMRNGLRVVSTRLPVVERSFCAEYLSFYDEFNPKQIADAIISAARLKSDRQFECLERMHSDFLSCLNNMIGRVIKA